MLGIGNLFSSPQPRARARGYGRARGKPCIKLFQTSGRTWLPDVREAAKKSVNPPLHVSLPSLLAAGPRASAPPPRVVGYGVNITQYIPVWD